MSLSLGGQELDADPQTAQTRALHLRDLSSQPHRFTPRFVAACRASLGRLEMAWVLGHCSESDGRAGTLRPRFQVA
jgi:hypothetical protein